jgi:hypothetical protein
VRHGDSLDPFVLVAIARIVGFFPLGALAHLLRCFVRTFELLARIFELDSGERADAFQFVLVKDIFAWMVRGDASFDPANKVGSSASRFEVGLP